MDKILEINQLFALLVSYMVFSPFIIEVNPFPADHTAINVDNETNVILELLYTSFTMSVITGIICMGIIEFIIAIMLSGAIGRYFKRLIKSNKNGTILNIM